MKTLNLKPICNLLVVILLATTASAGAKEIVARPFKISAHSEMVLDPQTGQFTATAWGQGTHIGNAISYAEGIFNPETGEGWSVGSIVTPNGDEIFFEQFGGIVFTGGTGKFENASGGWIPETEIVGMMMDDEGMLHIYFIWTGSGTVYY
jgi:hypothetical protein